MLIITFIERIRFNIYLLNLFQLLISPLYIFSVNKNLSLIIIILLGAVAFPCLAQQPFKTFRGLQKIKESEIPDHSVSPDSSYKYFGRWINDSVGHLFSKNLKTGDTISLTKGPGYYGKVIMSPSGRQLVYEWIIDDKFTEIRMVGIDGTNPRILYSDSVLFSLLQEWSPDEKYVSAMVFNKERTFHQGCGLSEKTRCQASWITLAGKGWVLTRAQPQPLLEYGAKM